MTSDALFGPDRRCPQEPQESGVHKVTHVPTQSLCPFTGEPLPPSLAFIYSCCSPPPHFQNFCLLLLF